MDDVLNIVIASSSCALRALTYVFLRWIPGHQAPPIIYTSAAVYFIGVLNLWSRKRVPSQLTQNRTKPQSTQEHDHSSPASQGDKTAPSEDQSWIASIPFYQQFLTFMLGVPNASHYGWSIVSLVINVLLVGMTVDMVYRVPLYYQSHDLSFSRIGFVSDRTAKVLVREPRPDHWPVSLSYRLSRGDPSISDMDTWKYGGSVSQLSEATDFTNTFLLPSLKSSTQYHYKLSNNHTGSFRTAAPPGTSKLTFLTSSCIKPRVPYSPFDHPLYFRGMQQLGALLPQLRASFMMFLGDFIYIDVPRRFGSSAEDYRRNYRQVYASPDWPAASRSLPWLHVLDDHEIANDWDRNITAPFPAAADPWHHYHASPNPPPVRENATYFSFTNGPASFFMMDTRRYRSPSADLPPDHPDKTMLGKGQLHDLKGFISRKEKPGVHFKFVVSSIPFTRSWRVNAADTWSGYLHERQILLEAMWDVSLSSDPVSVIVLSGDRHEFAATAFPPPASGKWPLSGTVHEFSTSPLNMFYLPLRSYRERKGEDEICIKYIPDGNSKFGVIELEGGQGGEQGIMKYRLFIDGKEVWSYVLTTPPAIAGSERGKDAIWG